VFSGRGSCQALDDAPLFKDTPGTMSGYSPVAARRRRRCSRCKSLGVDRRKLLGRLFAKTDGVRSLSSAARKYHYQARLLRQGLNKYETIVLRTAGFETPP
jgi:hypothetical protein